MKKIGIILALLFAFGLVGCSSSNSGDTTTPAQSETNTASVDSVATHTGISGESSEVTWGSALTLEFDELLLDADDVSIRAHGFSKGGASGNDGLVRLTVKNKTTNPVKVTAVDLTVNGQSVKSSFEEEVLVANSLDTDLILIQQELIDQDVTTVDEFSITFAVENAETGEEITQSKPLVVDLNA